jgi:hypothetical protein
MINKATRLACKLAWFPYLVYLVNYIIFLTTDFYPKYWWTDVILHYFGGISIAYSATVALEALIANRALTFKYRILQYALTISLVITAAVWWEFYEFISSVFYNTQHQPSNADTMKDLCMGTLGAMTYCLYHAIRNTKPTLKSESPKNN